MPSDSPASNIMQSMGLTDALISVPFQYGVTIATILTGQTLQTTLQLQQDSLFECHVWMGSTDQDDNVNPTGSVYTPLFAPNNFSVLIQDQMSGRFLMNAPIPQRIVCGPSNTGLKLSRPTTWYPNTQLNFAFTNLKSFTLTNVTFVWIGQKIFKQ
jgi:hypothetical protein